MALQKVSSYKLNSQVGTNSQGSVAYIPSTHSNARDSVSFGAAPGAKEVARTMEDMMPTILTGMKKAKDSMGEVQNIVINALGTGLIAPIFIKWNPLSKTDEDTRTYSAWRQPVSAVLAVATQATVTIPFNNAIKDMAKNGWFGEKFNETPYATKEAEEALIKSLKNQNKVFYNTSNYDGSSKLKEMNPESYKRLLTETLTDLLKKEEQEFARCSGSKKEARIARSKFYQAKPAESTKLLDELTTILDSNKDVKAVEKALKAKIKTMKADKVDAELIKMTEEVDGLGAILKENWFSKFLGLFTKKKSGQATYGDVVIASMKEKVNKMKGHVDIYRGLTVEQAEQHAADSIAIRLKEIENSKNVLNQAIEKIKNGGTVADIEDLFSREVFKNSTFRLKEKVFSREVAKKLKDLTQNNISIFKQISGLIVSCAMLPITCELLNRIYPVFMDAVFPNLSNKKHSNVSSKLVADATKNSEVK